MSNDSVISAVDRGLPDSIRLLKELISIPSLSGDETAAMLALEKHLLEVGIPTERVALDNSLRNDPEYSTPITGIDYNGRFNLRSEVVSNFPDGPVTILNAHIDTVPPSEGMDSPFCPTEHDGVIFGRGACDDKGPLACIVLILTALMETRAQWKGRVVAHFVVEEENGGNGSLAMVRQGEAADQCIVLEPTAGKLYTSIRGAVWFRLDCHGKAGHSGQAKLTRSALLRAHDAITALSRYHRKLLNLSRGFPLFDEYENPMPITFGRLESGNWPASAPNHAVLEGVLGFLPNRSREEICREFVEVLERDLGWSKEDYRITFTYRHDCSVLEIKHSLPVALINASKELRQPVRISAFPASCDATFYRNLAGIPTVVYGPGDLAHAHGKDEQIAIEDIRQSAEILTKAIINGLPKQGDQETGE